MFVLKQEPTVVWPVDIPMPVDGGKVQNIPVNVTYELIQQDEYDRLKGNDFDVLRRVVKGWGDQDFGRENVNGEHEATPFSAENLEYFIKFPFVRTGLLTGLWEAQAGIEKN